MATIAPGIDHKGSGLRIRINYKGQRYEETDPGPGDSRHVRRAIKRRDWLLSRLRLGLPVYEEDQALLGQIANQWFDSLDVKDSTLNLYLKTWRQWWQPWSDLSPAEITPHKIRARLAEFQVSSKTKKNALSNLRNILAFADTNPNPCDVVTLPRERKRYVERYEPEELEAVMKFLDDDHKIYFSILAGCGLRPGEALALRFEDYDGESLHITKQITNYRLVSSTKTGVRRKVYVPEWCRPIIESNPNRFKKSWMFMKASGEPYASASKHFNPAWKVAHRRANVRLRSPYVLRHTRAAQLLSQGANPALAASQLGHSVQLFLNLYSEWMPSWSGQDVAVLEPTAAPLSAPGRSITNKHAKTRAPKNKGSSPGKSS